MYAGKYDTSERLESDCETEKLCKEPWQQATWTKESGETKGPEDNEGYQMTGTQGLSL